MGLNTWKGWQHQLNLSYYLESSLLLGPDLCRGSLKVNQPNIRLVKLCLLQLWMSMVDCLDMFILRYAGNQSVCTTSLPTSAGIGSSSEWNGIGPARGTHALCPSEHPERLCQSVSSRASLPERLFQSVSARASLPERLFQSVSARGSLPERLFQSVSSRASLPEGLFQSVSSRASLPERLCQRVSSRASLPEGLFQSVSSRASLPEGLFQSVSSRASLPERLFQSVSSWASLPGSLVSPWCSAE